MKKEHMRSDPGRGGALVAWPPHQEEAMDTSVCALKQTSRWRFVFVVAEISEEQQVVSG